MNSTVRRPGGGRTMTEGKLEEKSKIIVKYYNYANARQIKLSFATWLGGAVNEIFCKA